MEDEKLKYEKLGECEIKLNILGLTNGVQIEVSWTVDNCMLYKDDTFRLHGMNDY